ncbi:MAG: hypothetical protein IKC77_02610 [Lentisphaeria bacterium]|nr:hypothetical protein [Lentisphaeria bacterium]
MIGSRYRKIFSNRFLCAAVAVTVCFLLFYLAANLLYPWRGDDFVRLYLLRTKSAFDLVKDSYLYWTLRLGNVICAFFGVVKSKIIFDIVNPFIQVVIFYLLAGTALGRFPDIRQKRDALLVIFASGLSVFVCRPADTVYWVPGATLYSWAAVVYLGFYLYLLRCEGQSKNSVPALLALAVFGFFAGYCNENIALAGLFFLAVRAVLKPSKKVFASLAGYFGGAVFLFTTPGALTRVASMQNGSTKLPISSMFGKLPEIAGFYIGSSIIPLAVLFILAVLFGRKCGKTVLLRAAAALGLSMFAALVYAGCPLPPMRSYYACNLLVMVSCCILFDGAVSNEKNKIIISLASLFCGAVMLAFAVPDFINIHRDECLRNRLVAEQRAKSVDVVTVPEHRTLRRSFMQYIFIEDISSDPEFWLNKNAALYYQVKAIKSVPGKEKTPLFRERFIKFVKGGKL